MEEEKQVRTKVVDYQEGRFAVNLEWERDLAMYVFIGNASTVFFSKVLDLRPNEVRVLMMAYMLDREFSTVDIDEMLGKKVSTTSADMLLPLMGRGLLQKTRDSSMKYNERVKAYSHNGVEPGLYYLTVEGKVIMDSYFAVVHFVSDRSRGLKVSEFFRSVDSVIEHGFRYYGYELNESGGLKRKVGGKNKVV